MYAVWLFFTLVGCPYPRAMDQAAALVERGEYRAALEHYDRALRARPRSDDANEARAATIDGAVAEALREAETTLTSGAWEPTLGHLAYVAALRPDHPDLVRIRTAVGDGLLTETRASIDAGAWVEAYDRAIRARTLVPERPEIAPILDRLRTSFYGWAEQAALDGDYRRSLGLLDEVARHEPDRASETDARRTDVRNRWATVVVVDAVAREQQALLGPALALRARAVEIAGRPEDRAAVDRLRAVLRQQAELPIELRWVGMPERTDPLVRAIQADLGQVGGLVWATGGVVADLRAPQAACSEGSTGWVAEQPYVSGQRQVANPAWVQLDAELREAHREVTGLVSQEQAARAQAERAAWDLAQIEQHTLNPLSAALEARRHDLENARVHAEGAGRMVAELEAQLARLQANGGADPAIAAIVLTLDSERQRLQHEQNRWTAANADVADLSARYDAAAAQAQWARDAAWARNTEHQAVASLLGQWRQELAEVQAQIAQTPATLLEDVHAIFRYEVVRWLRKCSAEATMTVSVPARPPRTERLVDAHETWDDAHPAWPAYGVAENVAWYPMSDADLIREIDLRLAPGLIAVARRAVDEAFAVRVADARQRFVADPDHGSALVLGLLLAAPSVVDADTRSRLQAHLAQRYELESPDSVFR